MAATFCKPSKDGDRLAAVYSHGELTSLIEKDGEWLPLRSAALQLTMDREDLAGWNPTFGLRMDAGEMAVDRVTLLQPGRRARAGP